MKHPKIVVNCRFLQQDVTGVQRYAIELSRQLRKTYNIDELVFVTPKLNKCIDRKLCEELNVIEIGSLDGHFWEQISLPIFLLGHGNPLLINFCGLSPVIYSRAILTIHDVSVYVDKNWFKFKYRFWYKTMFWLLARRLDKFITSSDFSKREIVSRLGVCDKKISVIYPTCKFDNYYQSKAVNGRLKILAVSSIDPRKNFKVIIEAVEHLESERFDILIAGGVGRAFKSSVSSIKNVSLLGYVSDDHLLKLYRNADIFIYPSLYEGFGIPPLEAMSQGCPVIASNAASIPEACGNAAIYFEPSQSKNLAFIIESLCDNKELRSDLIKKGYRNLERFNIEREFKKLISVVSEFEKR